MKQETVVQVHKIVKSDSSSDKSKKVDDKNDRTDGGTKGPSRDVSVDEESQINSKILSLIESEMSRDANKHTHFTESRPQSLSFYEDEKIPEELSGNLELLSPEERKHYRKRKEYSLMGTDDMNAYNVIQDLYKSHDNEDVLPVKKSKWRKKRHETETGIGDSRETMLPKEKKKTKKKKRESTSPSSSNYSKRKHKKRDDEHEPKTDIACALEELQDDVFEINYEEFNQQTKLEKSKSPKKCDNLYVQKKNRFKHVSPTTKQRLRDNNEDDEEKIMKHPIELAIEYQKYWIRFSMLCHGLLGGLALSHWLYLISNIYSENEEFIAHYSNYSGIYVCFFYFLCVICLISVLERIDLVHLDLKEIWKLFRFRKSSIVIGLYFSCLVIHLVASKIDFKFSMPPSNNETMTPITPDELVEWNHLSSWRSLLAFIAWIFVGLLEPDNMFYNNLRGMEKFKK